jgi:sucrose phosphorylase
MSCRSFPIALTTVLRLSITCRSIPSLGDWDDIKRIAASFNLMVDLVVNHVSSQHAWFEQFKRNEAPGKDYFITADPDEDVSQVVRPRSSPLLTPVETVEGTKYMYGPLSARIRSMPTSKTPMSCWSTSRSFCFTCRPEPVTFAWMRWAFCGKSGTNCMHLPETHALVRLFREILQLIDPGIAIITETNVPNRENLSYFGNRNEAHMIYNFSLPPLLLNALIAGAVRSPEDLDDEYATCPHRLCLL